MGFAKTLAAVVALILLSQAASAQAPPWLRSLRAATFGLGWIMMALMGVRWIISDSPNERADVKKSMIYIVLGVLIVANACNLLQMYCDNARPAITCTASTYCS